MNEHVDFKIYEPPEERRYWVVKADAGKYFEIFTSHSLIAIGHLNEFVSDSSCANPFISNSKQIRRMMTIMQGDKEYYNSNNYGQVNSFVNEMKVGDWVLTKGDGVVRVGRIESKPRLDTESQQMLIKQGTRHEKTLVMDFMLKRTVRWGPTIKTAHLPLDIFISLKSPMTLYNSDRYMESICYCLYPFFKIDNFLYLSIRISQKDELRNFYITKIFEYLNELEFLSKLDGVVFNKDELGKMYHDFAIAENFSLSTQASFHSPGDIWAKLGFNGSSVTPKMIKAVCIYAMLFGNSHLGMDGIIDVESRQKLWDILAKRIDIEVTQGAAKKLKLEIPKYDTENIEGMDVK